MVDIEASYCEVWARRWPFARRDNYFNNFG